MYSLETLNTSRKEYDSIDGMQMRVYRRALGLARPYVAQQKGLEYFLPNPFLGLRGSKLLGFASSMSAEAHMKRSQFVK